MSDTLTSPVTMDFDSIQKGIEEAFEAYHKLLEAATAPLNDALIKWVTDNPKIEKIYWTQYTPYFNDGDPCIFGVNEIKFKVTGAESDESDEDYDDEDYEEIEDRPWFSIWLSRYNRRTPNEEYDYNLKTDYHWETDFLNREEYLACYKIANFLSSEAGEKLLLAAFDDHVQVTVSPEGLAVLEYEHD